MFDGTIYNNLLWWYYNEPRMEYLIKGGFYGLVKDFTTDCTTAHLMKGKDIKSVLGLDGQGVARLRQAGGGVAYLDWLRKAFMCGFKIPEKTIRYFIKKKIYPHEVAEEIKQGASPEQIANYIEKQRKMCNSSADYIVTTWRDLDQPAKAWLPTLVKDLGSTIPVILVQLAKLLLPMLTRVLNRRMLSSAV